MYVRVLVVQDYRSCPRWKAVWYICLSRKDRPCLYDVYWLSILFLMRMLIREPPDIPMHEYVSVRMFE